MFWHFWLFDHIIYIVPPKSAIYLIGTYLHSALKNLKINSRSQWTSRTNICKSLQTIAVSKIQDPRFRIQDSESWTLDLESWIQVLLPEKHIAIGTAFKTFAMADLLANMPQYQSHYEERCHNWRNIISQNLVLEFIGQTDEAFNTFGVSIHDMISAQRFHVSAGMCDCMGHLMYPKTKTIKTRPLY